MKFRLITTVWGREFADLFLRVTVRSLLSEGNMAAFAGRYPAVYVIYTTEDTVEVLRRSPLFRQLERTIDTQFVIFRSGDIDRDNSSSHWTGWRKGVQAAREHGEIACFIIADMLYPASAMARWIDRFEQGYRAIWTSTVQVVQETALTELESLFPEAATRAISLSSQDVVDLAIRHLHPKFVAMFRDSGRASRHPEVVFAAVPGEGWAERAIGSHAFCVDPGFFDLSDALSPLNRFEAIAFEPPTGVGLEPLLKQADLYARREPLDDDRVSNMGAWLDYFFTPPDLIESRRTYRFAYQSTTRDADFRDARDSLGFLACQIRLTGAIYRVVREMRRVGCTVATQVAATAHYAGRLRRRWRTKGPVTAFVPDNAAIERWGLHNLHTLMMPGNEKALADAVAAHLYEGIRAHAVGDSFAVAADAPFAAVARIIGGPYQRDECTFYVIDRVLFSLPRHESEPALLPNKWDVHATRLFASAAGSTPPPVAESPVEAVEPSPPPLPIRLRVRGVVRTVYYQVRRIPGAARPVDWLKSTILMFLSRARARRDRTIGESVAAVGADGVAATANATSHTATHAPSKDLVELFRDLQRARAVLTLAELLRFYRDKVSGLTADLPPLAMVERCIHEARLSEDGLAASLEGLLDRAPDFAEAWYELGDMLLARGHRDEAIRCFDRCLTSKEALRTYARTSCYVLAAASKAAALEASGFTEAAAETYRRAMDTGGQSGMAHVAYARLLRRLGRPRDAAAHFDLGLESDGTVCDFPSMPRDFTAMAARLARQHQPAVDGTANAAAS